VTAGSQQAVGTASESAAPTVAWPALIDEARALAWLRKRLSGVEDARAQLYHHPMLAASYEVRRRSGSASAHALVDLVGGRAYAAEPWGHIRFIPLEVARRTGGTAAAETTAAAAAAASDASERTLTDPVRVLDDVRGEHAARTLVRSVLLRGRRLGSPGRLHPLGEPLVFGKPNWWLTGTRGGKPVEIILDGLTGRHYALKA
jgi:hypothetical protein